MMFLGYDPGGNDRHGVAALHVDNGRATSIDITTLPSAEHVLKWFLQRSEVQTPQCIGVDTLTNWSTGRSGLRPADRWLRGQYPEVAGSVMASNSLFGAMPVNGMAVLLALRDNYPGLAITETHPKVLYFDLCRTIYNFDESEIAKTGMNQFLEGQLELPAQCQTEHEWDAAISALAAYRWHSSSWTSDLHSMPWSAEERSVQPCGLTHYAWPNE
jgi:hypothetical protein